MSAKVSINGGHVATESVKPPEERTEHHVWCNYFHLPVQICRMCPGMWARFPYPQNNGEEAGLLKKHFPEAIQR